MHFWTQVDKAGGGEDTRYIDTRTDRQTDKQTCIQHPFVLPSTPDLVQQEEKKAYRQTERQRVSRQVCMHVNHRSFLLTSHTSNHRSGLGEICFSFSLWVCVRVCVLKRRAPLWRTILWHPIKACLYLVFASVWLLCQPPLSSLCSSSFLLSSD